jgi:hypothetical protein
MALKDKFIFAGLIMEEANKMLEDFVSVTHCFGLDVEKKF